MARHRSRQWSGGWGAFVVIFDALGLLCAGCTFEAGSWFATLEPRFRGQLVTPADRDLGGGWQKLNNDFELLIEEAAVDFGPVVLEAPSDDGAGGFDPARPPAGYSLCHGGHCHSDDGRLVPYDEIAAELGGSAARAVVRLPVGAVDLLAPVERSLACEPRCELSFVRLRRARAPVLAVRFLGRVRDPRGRLVDEAPFRWEEMAPTRSPIAEIEGALDLPADNRHPPRISLALKVELGPSLFDGIDWTALPDREGRRDVAGARIRVGEALSVVPLVIAVSRRND